MESDKLILEGLQLLQYSNLDIDRKLLKQLIEIYKNKTTK